MYWLGSIIVAFIVLVKILINKDKSNTPSDDSKDVSINPKRIESRDSRFRKGRQSRDTVSTNPKRIESRDSRFREGRQSRDAVSTNPKRIESRDSVVIKDIETGEKNKYQLVGTDEPNAEIGKISITSPLGGSLIGKEIGDDVEVITPGGIREFIVIDIE